MSVDVEHASMSCKEMMHLLNMESPRCFEKGSLSVRGEPRDRSVVVFDSPLDDRIDVDEQLEAILGELPMEGFRAATATAGIQVKLNIGVLYCGAYAAVRIRPSHMLKAASVGIALEINCYPCIDS